MKISIFRLLDEKKKLRYSAAATVGGTAVGPSIDRSHIEPLPYTARHRVTLAARSARRTMGTYNIILYFYKRDAE